MFTKVRIRSGKHYVFMVKSDSGCRRILFPPPLLVFSPTTLLQFSFQVVDENTNNGVAIFLFNFLLIFSAEVTDSSISLELTPFSSHHESK